MRPETAERLGWALYSIALVMLFSITNGLAYTWGHDQGVALQSLRDDNNFQLRYAEQLKADGNAAEQNGGCNYYRLVCRP